MNVQPGNKSRRTSSKMSADCHLPPAYWNGWS